MTDLAVVIVSWNTRELTLQTLQTLFADLETSGLNTSVVVVDNGSTDGSSEAVAETFPQVTLFALTDNLGFGGGNNYALRQIGFGTEIPGDDLPRAVYLLNSDTITQPGATRALYDALLADTSVGWVGARLTYGDGSFQDGAFAFPGLKQLWAEFFPTPGRFILGGFNGRYPQTRYTGDAPFSVDFTLGATVMLKREVIQQTGMFDNETFFMYCEEIDWAWRVHRAGWEVQCVPAAHVVHLGGQSTSQVRARSVVDLWASRLKLFKRYYPRWKLWLALRMVALGMKRKLKQAHQDDILSPEQREELITAYDQVRQMAARRKSAKQS
jgi:N-acetylglucosaminyl-diphospho-decaprenol L-rhamnosyltransferase